MSQPTKDVTDWVANLKTLLGSSLAELGSHSSAGSTESYRVYRAALQSAVFSELNFSALCHPDGVVYPCPNGMDDDVLDAQFREHRFSGVPIDTLVSRALDLVINENQAEAATQFRTLRFRLLRALEAVDLQLAELDAKKQTTQ